MVDAVTTAKLQQQCDEWETSWSSSSNANEINRIAQMFGGFIGPSCRLLIIPPGIDLTIMTREEIDARAIKGADAPPPRLTPPL